jgi:hypothetical protein
MIQLIKQNKTAKRGHYKWQYSINITKSQRVGNTTISGRKRRTKPTISSRKGEEQLCQKKKRRPDQGSSQNKETQRTRKLHGKIKRQQQ